MLSCVISVTNAWKTVAGMTITNLQESDDTEQTVSGTVADLEDILAESRDYDRLLAVWKGWRNVTGPKMKSLYQEFVALSNEGVRELGQ